VGTDTAVTASVVEQLPQGKYRVKLENGQVVLAHPASETKKNFVRLLPGDKVEVVLAPEDWQRGRITKKL
jgi:translation initiation factor IF-1